MVDQGKVKWAGFSGKDYSFAIYPVDECWADVPGNYIFATMTPSKTWIPVCIGETGSLKAEFSLHKKSCVCCRTEAMHIHIHVNPDKEERLVDEADLKARYNLPCVC